MMIPPAPSTSLRTITLGINIRDCVHRDAAVFRKQLLEEFVPVARRVRETVYMELDAMGIGLLNFRLAVTSVGTLHNGWNATDYLTVAAALEELAALSGADLIGGVSAFIEDGIDRDAEAFIEALPEALSNSERLCGFLNVASTSEGIHFESVRRASDIPRQLFKHMASPEANNGATRFGIVCNVRANTPYMPTGFHSDNTKNLSLNIGVGGIEALNATLEEQPDDLPIQQVIQLIADRMGKLTKKAEKTGKILAQKTNVPLGCIDISLTPLPWDRNFSILHLFRLIGVTHIDTPGSLAVLAAVNEAIKRGGLMGSPHVKGLSGSFLSVSEDSEIFKSTESRSISMDRLLALTSVCSVGIDMVALPADTEWHAIAGLVADEMALGCLHNKTTAVRLILADGRKGDTLKLSGHDFFGQVRVTDLDQSDNTRFIRRPGFIPPFIQSFRN